MILVVDYGVGNIASFTKALRHLALPFRVSADPAALDAAPLAVLIGVGHFGGVMEKLEAEASAPA